MPQLLLNLMLIGIGWFLLIRPQQQRVRQQRELVASVEVGDRVITAGGIHGTLLTVDEETVRLEVAPGTVLTLARAAMAHRVEEGEEAGEGDEADVVRTEVAHTDGAAGDGRPGRATDDDAPAAGGTP